MGGDGIATGTRGLAADVEEVGALGFEAAGEGNGCVDVASHAVAAEGIGRDVDDAADVGAFAPGEASATQFERGRGVSASRGPFDAAHGRFRE